MRTPGDAAEPDRAETERPRSDSAAGAVSDGDAAPPMQAGPDHPPQELRYGRAGRPLNRHSPFYIGFVGAAGAIIAYGLWQLVGKLTGTLTTIVVSLFLALALDPIVRWLSGRGLTRARAVAIVFAGVLVAFGFLGFLVLPPVLQQGAELMSDAPGYVEEVLNSDLVQRLDRDYDVVATLEREINSRLTDAGFMSRIFGGVLGAGLALVNGLFQVFTILILTLYFVASLPRMKQAVYAMLPASRRPRVEPLTDEILRRTGAYAIGQASIASINAICSYVMMLLVGIPYAAVLAVVVGALGLIPMIGATLGAIIVVAVALFHSVTAAVIAGVYYIVYQQLENYVVAPRVMARTVSVPGAITVVAALAGGALLGVLGALLAIPVAAGLLLLYDEVLVPRQRRM